ncbi:putative carbohydrate esterase [Salvia divinorum]|uniref:Carbohydrate esterase n=1 Tax=Salvia divinorum TaxID=28513 RepID=A0ABD1GT25_SALDI
MNSLVWLTILCCSTLVSSQNKPQSIFILAGQSNMAGRAGIIDGKWDNKVPPECKPSPQIQRLNAKLEWEEARDPLHKGIDHRVSGIGPGMSFANAVLAKDPNIGVIGLVPCAVGGTTIDEWNKGMKLYNDMIDRAKAALKDGGALRALLWYQGESDTSVLQNTMTYKVKFEKFIADVRGDLQTPTLPVVQVVVTSGDGDFVKEMRNTQKSINVPNLKQVDSKGLELLMDHLHLTTESQVKVGHMLADAYLQF